MDRAHFCFPWNDLNKKIHSVCQPNWTCMSHKNMPSQTYLEVFANITTNCVYPSLPQFLIGRKVVKRQSTMKCAVARATRHTAESRHCTNETINELKDFPEELEEDKTVRETPLPLLLPFNPHFWLLRNPHFGRMM